MIYIDDLHILAICLCFLSLFCVCLKHAQPERVINDAHRSLNPAYICT